MSRVTKPKLARTRPIRMASAAMKAPEGERTRDRDSSRKRPSASGREPLPTSDYVAQGVKVGYDVLESYLRRAQEMARDLRKRPAGLDPRDPSDVLDRSVRVVRQYAILMMELSETLMKAPDLLRDFRRLLQREGDGKPSAGPAPPLSQTHADSLAGLGPVLQALLNSAANGARGASPSVSSSPHDGTHVPSLRVRFRAGTQCGTLVVTLKATHQDGHLKFTRLVGADPNAGPYDLGAVSLVRGSKTEPWEFDLRVTDRSLDAFPAGKFWGAVIDANNEKLGDIELTISATPSSELSSADQG